MLGLGGGLVAALVGAEVLSGMEGMFGDGGGGGDYSGGGGEDFSGGGETGGGDYGSGSGDYNPYDAGADPTSSYDPSSSGAVGGHPLMQEVAAQNSLALI